MAENKDHIVPYEYRDYAKSNLLIGAKYKSSLLENKIMAVSLSRIQNFVEDTTTGALLSRISASELRKMMNANDGSFYSQLDQAAQSMTGKTIGMSMPEKKTFDYIAVIIRAYYKDGLFTIEYNPHLKNYIQDIKQNFTILNLPVMLSFKSVYSFRLYELLKSKAFYPKGVKLTDNVFKISFQLSELKLNLGVVNAELDKVRRVLKNSSNPDYDKAVEVSPERAFDNWYEFKRKVLDIAKKEINEKTELDVDYTTMKKGRGGKVYQVDFIVSFRKNMEKVKPVEPKELSLEEKDQVMDEIMELIKEPIKLKEVRSIAEAANYDTEKVRKAYAVLQHSSQDIDNLVGFMIKAIQDDYDLPISKKATTSNPFNAFLQNDYDFAQLELELIDN